MKTVSPSYSPSSDGRAASANANASGVPSPSVTAAPVPSTPSSNAASFGEAPVGDAQSSGKVTQPAPEVEFLKEEAPVVQPEVQRNTEQVFRIQKVAPVVGLTASEKEITVKSKDGRRVKVKLLHGLPVSHNGEMYYAVVTTEGDFKGYLVKADSVDTSDSKSILVSDVVELYDWSAELEYLLGDTNLIKRNALLSFWRAGAFFEADKENDHIRASMFDSAFPYKMP